MFVPVKQLVYSLTKGLDNELEFDTYAQSFVDRLGRKYVSADYNACFVAYKDCIIMKLTIDRIEFLNIITRETCDNYGNGDVEKVFENWRNI